MGMKEFIDNINDDKFSEAREEINTHVQSVIGDRVAAKREELGLEVPVVEGEGDSKEGEGDEE